MPLFTWAFIQQPTCAIYNASRKMRSRVRYTMPKSKPVASLSNLIYSDMEGEHDEIDTSLDSNDKNIVAGISGKKGPGRAIKAKAATTRSTRLQTAQSKAVPIVAIKKPMPGKKNIAKRTVLKEQTGDEDDINGDEIGHNEQVGEVMEKEKKVGSIKEQASNHPPKRGRPAKKAKQELKEESVQPAKTTENDGEFEYTPVAVRTAPKKPGPTAKHAASGRPNTTAEPHSEKIIPETQLPSLYPEIQNLEEDGDTEEELPQSSLPQRRFPEKLPGRKRAGSISDADRATENPASRRRVGEVTKKLDAMDVKYKNLREVGIKEAEANFERLKAQSETQAAAANDLIQSLRKELATQTAIAQESRSLQRQLAARDAALSKAEKDVVELTTSVSEAQNEIKTLQAKLANSRTAAVAVESVNARTPGNATNNKASQPRTIMMGSVEAAQAAQIALMKEDLYSDLTGLILRGVERREESDIYDCIQTGRNGTLHFKLTIANDIDAKANYENTTFLYTPRLDSHRDRDLLELLPDYLGEEIAFSRVNAAKFYGRVMETLTKRRVED